MKNIFLLLAWFGLGNATLFAQKHTVYWLPLAAGVKNISFAYEYAFKPNISFCVQGSYRPFQKTHLPFITLEWGEFGTIFRDKTTLQSGGFTLTPELRFYTSKQKKADGFYYSIYLRNYYYEYVSHSRFLITEEWDYGGQPKGNVGFTCKGNYYATRPGFQLGYKWVMTKRLMIDTFYGFNIGNKSTKTEIVITELTSNAITQSEIEQTILRNAPIFGNGILKQNNSNSYSLNNSKISLGIRMGVALGYTF